MIRVNKDGQNEISIINIFESINGEGYAAGKPTVFIRTMGCNLRCSFCFGSDSRGQYPYVLNKFGRLIALNDVKIGDEILTMDPITNITKVTKVTNVMSRSANNIRQVNFGRVGVDHFYVTGEHPFYQDGWKPIDDIEIGSKVKRNLYGNILNYLINNNLKKTLTDYSDLVVKRYIEKHKASPNFGDKNGKAIAGTSRNFVYLKAAINEGLASDYPYYSEFPNTGSTLQVHHLDQNHNNDAIENLVILPAQTHNKIHLRGNHFSKNSDLYSIELTKKRPRRFQDGYSNIVVNIETEDHSYYIMSSKKGSALLVHNCDTKECWTKENFHKVYPERDDFMWLTAQEIFNRVEKMEKGWKHKSICLTGGEPLMEENKNFMIEELLPRFVDAGYDVAIETNGAIDYTDYKMAFGDSKIVDSFGSRQGITIVADYKLPCSGMTQKMVQENFKIYSDMDIVKMVISDNPHDWQELDRIVNEIETKASIYLSPCFGEVTLTKIPNYVIKHCDKNIKAQIQLHKIFWSPMEKDV